MGFGMSRPEARQLVMHGHFEVNGKKVDIPSYLVSVGDVITIREKSRGSEKFKAILEATSGKIIPKWLDVNHDAAEGKVIAAPQRDDVDLELEEHLIVELYSK